MSSELEQQARNEIICRGCGENKEKGLVVCWECFKYREDTVPLKYSNLDFAEWLKLLHKH